MAIDKDGHHSRRPLGVTLRDLIEREGEGWWREGT